MQLRILTDNNSSEIPEIDLGMRIASAPHGSKLQINDIEPILTTHPGITEFVTTMLFHQKLINGELNKRQIMSTYDYRFKEPAANVGDAASKLYEYTIRMHTLFFVVYSDPLMGEYNRLFTPVKQADFKFDLKALHPDHRAKLIKEVPNADVSRSVDMETLESMVNLLYVTI